MTAPKPPTLYGGMPEGLVMLNQQHSARRLKWDHRYLGVAQLVAAWSKDPSTKVGAVVVRADNTIAATGFNGFPPGHDDDPKLYADRNYKYQHIIHAEDNALRRCSDVDCAGATIYSSFPICPTCMRRIVSRGVLRAVCPKLITEGRDVDWVNQWQALLAETLFIARAKGVQVVLLDV